MSTSVQNSEELTQEEKCQMLMEAVVDQRVRYPAHIAKLNEKIVKIRISILEKTLKSHRDVKIRVPKYDINVDMDLREIDRLQTSFKKQREKLQKLKTLRAIANQIKCDGVGKMLNENIDSMTFVKRVQERWMEKQKT